MRVDWCVSSWFRIKNTHSLTTCWRQAEDYQNEHAPCTSLLLSPIRGGNFKLATIAPLFLQNEMSQTGTEEKKLAEAAHVHTPPLPPSACASAAPVSVPVVARDCQ